MDSLKLTLLQQVIAGGFSLLPIFLAWFVKREKSKRIKAERDLLTALGDIEFLCETEARLLEIVRESTGEHLKIRVRHEIAKSKGLRWSGKYTPGRAKEKRLRLETSINSEN
jgi:hypothetical protein